MSASGPSLESDIKLVLSAEDRASPEITAAISKINSRYRAFRNEQRVGSRIFEMQNPRVMQFGRGLGFAASMAGRATSIIQRYNVQMIHLGQVQRRVIDSQKDLNSAIAQYGSNSRQAASAARQLSEAKAAQAQANQESMINNVLLGVQTAGFAAQGIKGIGKLGGLRGMNLAKFAGGALRTAGVVGAGLAIGVGGAYGISRLIEGEDVANERLSTAASNFGLGGGQKIQNISINTNEIGVTADDVLNSSDVFG